MVFMGRWHRVADFCLQPVTGTIDSSFFDVPPRFPISSHLGSKSQKQRDNTANDFFYYGARGIRHIVERLTLP